MQDKKYAYEERLLLARERLREDVSWYPNAALVSFALVFILTGHLLPGLNPRQGNYADIITFEAQKQKNGAIWIGVFPENDKLILLTSEHGRIVWSLNDPTKDEMDTFKKYLSKRTTEEAVSTGVSLSTSLAKTTVVLAVDQRLNYAHLRPILEALAHVKITHYGFETRILHQEAHKG